MNPDIFNLLYSGFVPSRNGAKRCLALEKTKPLAPEIKKDDQFYLKRAQERRERRAAKKGLT